MGTRASFWEGDPRDLQNRKWLGCVAWDGYPDGIDGIAEVTTLETFRNVVEVASKRDDFSDPSKGWPFPWDKDIFLTDYTYAFFDGELRLACYHTGFFTMKEYAGMDDDAQDNAKDLAAKRLPHNVPAPLGYNREQPDSIIILVGREENL